MMKSRGPNSFHSRIIKEVWDQGALPLKIIFEESFLQERGLKESKMANITANFKKGDGSDASNYRSVSLTSKIGNITELS